MALYQPESFFDTTLASAITADAATISVTSAPNITEGYMVIEANTSNREIIKYTGVSGNNLTGCVRGLASFGSDDSAGTGKAHAAGVDVANRNVHFYYAEYYNVLGGTSAFPGVSTFYDSNTVTIGDMTGVEDTNRFFYTVTSSVSAFWGLSSSGAYVISEDGSTSYVISAGGSGVTAGDGIDISTGVVSVDKLSTGALRISSSKLAVGVDGDTIQVNGSNQLYSAASTTIFNDYTEHNQSNSTDEFTILTATIPANTLGTTGGIEWKVYVNTSNNNSGTGWMFKVYYGAIGSPTEVINAQALNTGNQKLDGVTEGIILAAGATDSQVANMSLHFGNYEGDTGQEFEPKLIGGQPGTCTEDSTVDLEFKVTMKCGGASGDIYSRFGYIRKL